MGWSKGIKKAMINKLDKEKEEYLYGFAANNVLCKLPTSFMLSIQDDGNMLNISLATAKHARPILAQVYKNELYEPSQNEQYSDIQEQIILGVNQLLTTVNISHGNEQSISLCIEGYPGKYHKFKGTITQVFFNDKVSEAEAHKYFKVPDKTQTTSFLSLFR